MTRHGNRFLSGFGWGVTATLVMSAVMILGMATGMSPMPRPIPAAIIGNLGGGGLPQPAMMGIAALAHLGYGGSWGGVLARATRPVTVWKGLGLGVALWIVMQVLVLPFLGWGFFGTSVTLEIAVATLVLHLVYGAVLGGLTDRHMVSREGRETEGDAVQMEAG